MIQRRIQHRRHSQLERLEKRNLLAFGLRSLLASSFHDASVLAAEVARSTAPIIASSTLAADVTPAEVAVSAPVSTFSAIQTLQSVESTPQAASMLTSADLESVSELDADSVQPNSIESSSAESLPAERFSLRTRLLASAQPNTTYQLLVAGVTLGTVTTDGAGNLSLELTPVPGNRDEDTGSDGPVDELLSKSPEHVPSDESPAVDPVSEASHGSDFADANGNADDLADAETSDLMDQTSDDQCVGDDGQTENSPESNGSEGVADSPQDVGNDSQDDTDSRDDNPSLSYQLIDQVHSDVDGRVADVVEGNVLQFGQDSSRNLLDDKILESHESNESDEQQDIDSLSGANDDGSFDDDSHIDDDRDDLLGVGPNHDSDDVGADDDEVVGDTDVSNLSHDDDLFDDDSRVGDDHDDVHDLSSNHDFDDVDTDSDDGVGGDSDRDANNQSHVDELFNDDSHVGDDLDDSEYLDSSHDSDDVVSGNDDILGIDTGDNNLSNDLDNDDGSSPDDIPVVAGSTTQAYGEWKTYLSGNGTAEIEFEKERGETEFEVEARGFAPIASFPVTIGGVLVGQIHTDSRGRGKLEYEIGDDHYRPFPTDFPVIETGVTIQIGTQLSGVFGSARSRHHDE